MAVRLSKKAKSPRISGVVLAAGEAVRMGSQKLLLRLGEHAMVELVVDAALGAELDETIVVVGHQAAAVSGVLGSRPVRVVMNHEYALGMSTSLQVGIRALRPDCDAAIFMLGDQPFVTSALIDCLVSRFAEAGAWIVRPVAGGCAGHPVLMSAVLFPEILDQRGDIGAREVVSRYAEHQCLVPVTNPFVNLDIDTPAEFDMAMCTWGYLGREQRRDEFPVQASDRRKGLS
jgi:molybdenum cofactor cytidylyltransferase